VLFFFLRWQNAGSAQRLCHATQAKSTALATRTPEAHFAAQQQRAPPDW